jgi:hypothetical protein
MGEVVDAPHCLSKLAQSLLRNAAKVSSWMEAILWGAWVNLENTTATSPSVERSDTTSQADPVRACHMRATWIERLS